MSSKLSNLVSLAGAQVPTDLAYVVDLSAGLAGSKSSTLNDLFGVITKNITDGALRFQGFAAPALSAAGQGAIYFDSGANVFKASQNGGAYANLIGGGGTPGGANTEIQFNSAGAFGGVTGATSDGANITFGSQNLIATSPIIGTGINDPNGNEQLTFSVAAAAVNQLDISNSATGVAVTIATVGGDGNIVMLLAPKGTARLESSAPFRLSGTGTDTFTTPVGSGVPTKINIPLFSPGGFGQILAFGLTNAAPNSARVLSLFDQRGSGHQPTIQIFNPNEDALLGFTWDGSNSIAQVFTDQIMQISGLRILQKTPATAPTDADIPNSSMSIWIDEGANNLIFRTRNSAGTLQTGTVALV
jgi:hypothetical protein